MTNLRSTRWFVRPNGAWDDTNRPHTHPENSADDLMLTTASPPPLKWGLTHLHDVVCELGLGSRQDPTGLQSQGRASLLSFVSRIVQDRVSSELPWVDVEETNTVSHCPVLTRAKRKRRTTTVSRWFQELAVWLYKVAQKSTHTYSQGTSSLGCSRWEALVPARPLSVGD